MYECFELKKNFFKKKKKMRGIKLWQNIRHIEALNQTSFIDIPNWEIAKLFVKSIGYFVRTEAEEVHDSTCVLPAAGTTTPLAFILY